MRSPRLAIRGISCPGCVAQARATGRADGEVDKVHHRRPLVLGIRTERSLRPPYGGGTRARNGSGRGFAESRNGLRTNGVAGARNSRHPQLKRIYWRILPSPNETTLQLEYTITLLK